MKFVSHHKYILICIQTDRYCIKNYYLKCCKTFIIRFTVKIIKVYI